MARCRGRRVTVSPPTAPARCRRTRCSRRRRSARRWPRWRSSRSSSTATSTSTPTSTRCSARGDFPTASTPRRTRSPSAACSATRRAPRCPASRATRWARRCPRRWRCCAAQATHHRSSRSPLPARCRSTRAAAPPSCRYSSPTSPAASSPISCTTSCSGRSAWSTAPTTSRSPPPARRAPPSATVAPAHRWSAGTTCTPSSRRRACGPRPPTWRGSSSACNACCGASPVVRSHPTPHD